MKINELRELTKDELQLKLNDFTEEMFNLRVQKATNRLENPMRIKAVRKDIARINTLLTEMERGNNGK
ncbi:MAG: 50S ribosomal protein L29 [Candidatus Cloacimonadota bacterium]|nr:MAG: 50S ribosomal protein L29 [Candidatus Cloacimonadota bacterium]RLC54367.1 MAG: 50S ribosomal protein L29 [Candidatus Cloacimonadota bacterium]